MSLRIPWGIASPEDFKGSTQEDTKGGDKDNNTYGTTMHMERHMKGRRGGRHTTRREDDDTIAKTVVVVVTAPVVVTTVTTTTMVKVKVATTVATNAKTTRQVLQRW